MSGPVAGVVGLSANASDPSTGVQQVVFERSPAGASTWTTIGTDTSAPYAANWNTGAVADGLYDLRAVATDTLGHTTTDVVASRRVDNTARQRCKPCRSRADLQHSDVLGIDSRPAQRRAREKFGQ